MITTSSEDPVCDAMLDPWSPQRDLELISLLAASSTCQVDLPHGASDRRHRHSKMKLSVYAAL